MRRALAFLVVCHALAVPSVGVAAEVMDGRTFYFGELHAHTGYSWDGGSVDLGTCVDDSCGDVAAFFDDARYVYGLDFCAITDHINGAARMPPVTWQRTIDLVTAANDPAGGFVALLGGEFIFGNSGHRIGHKNALFFGNDRDWSAITTDDMRALSDAAVCDEIWAAFAEIDQRFGPVLLIPHHPAGLAPMPTDWSCYDPVYSPTVEIYSNHGNSRDIDDPYDPLWGGTEENSTINHVLSPDHEGLVLGIIGGTDSHDTHPGDLCHLDVIRTVHPYGGSLTGLWLDEGAPFDRSSIRGAIEARHTYATTGPKIPVMLRVIGDGGLQVARMGDRFGPPPSAPATIEVTLPPAFDPYVSDVRLYQVDGTEVSMTHVAAGRFELVRMLDAGWFGYAVVEIDGASYWDDAGIDCPDGGDDDTGFVWTSPIWALVADPNDDDGDGVSELDGDCDDGDPEMHVYDLDGDGFSPCGGDCADNDPEMSPLDLDGDGYSACDGDCDETSAAIGPAAEELPCDGIDNDCDGRQHEFDLDGDADGFTECCGDCDDDAMSVFPGAVELDNGIDDDCDGQVDEGLGRSSSSSAGGCRADVTASRPSDPARALVAVAALAALAALSRRRH